MHCSEIGQINCDMIYSTHRNFVSDTSLRSINDELCNSPGWIFRTNFWRYYLAPGLRAYNETDPNSWYGNQNIMEKLSLPWQRLFERVQDLAGPQFVIQRYALTGQTQQQHQTLHYDTSKDLVGDFRSYLIYLNDKWHSSQGGATYFVNEHNQSHLEFPEPGKLVEFNSQMLHCGNPPEVSNLLRLTLVIHGQLR